MAKLYIIDTARVQDDLDSAEALLQMALARAAKIDPISEERSALAVEEIPDIVADFRRRIKVIDDILALSHDYIEPILQAGEQVKNPSDSQQLYEAYKQTIATLIDKCAVVIPAVIDCITHLEEQKPIDPKHPLQSLRTNHALLKAFVDAFQENPNRREIKKDMACAPRSPTKQPSLHLDLRGAALPETLPFIAKFAEKCRTHLDKETLFEKLLNELQRLARKATKGKQKAYVTRGAENGFRSFCEAFKQESQGRYTVYTSDQEYGAMFSNLDRRCIEIVPFERGIHDKDPCLMAYDLNKRLETAPVGRKVVFLSSVCRNGAYRIATNQVIAAIKKVHPDAEIWVDAAQDNMFFPDADLVVYSKRFGGTGGGMNFLGKRYQTDQYHSALRLSSGYLTEKVAACCGILFSQQNKIGNSLEDLNATPTLWKTRWKGTYIDSQARRFADELKGTSFGRHFETCYIDESKIEDPSYWKHGRIISFLRRRGSRANVRDVAEALERRRIYVDKKSISQQSGWKELVDFELKEDGTEQAQISAHFKRILEFEEQHKDTLVGTLIHPNFKLVSIGDGKLEVPKSHCTPDNFQRQQTYLVERGEMNEFIRIFIDVSISEEDITAVIEAIKSLSL